MELLLEMFPACTVSQAQTALAMALGNLEEAVQLIIEEKVEISPVDATLKVPCPGSVQGAGSSRTSLQSSSH